ncbi:MAG: sigma-54 dependent transcriptional regulator [Deltaproteobacteria bacterium]|nr:sigma-54 dependent transcriptional regulator [Deltaproteobacteria bacterium]
MFDHNEDTVTGHILLADDDEGLRYLVVQTLLAEGHKVDQAADGYQALKLLERHGYHLVITDLNMPGPGGMEIIDYVQEHTPTTPVIVMTGFGSVDTAVGAMRQGAFDFVEKPLNMERFLFAVKRALEKAALDHAYNYLRHEQPYIYRLEEILAESPGMKEVVKQIIKVATSDATVLITGETGTGKSLIAGAIHFNSARRAGSLVTVNCAALAETLLESELFGHEKGAFTGAHKARVGRFQQAHGGTLFLDEVGDMSPSLQAKVLRAIEEKIIERVGGPRSIEVDVRIISATNLDLTRAVKEGAFREDLFYRLNVATIHTPPLRERREDIIPLAELFSRRMSSGSRKGPKYFSPAAKDAMLSHDWPGNIREMRNAVERALIFATGDEVSPEDLDLQHSGRPPAPVPAPSTLNLADLERQAITTALERCDGVQKDAAVLLGITPRNLHYKLTKLKLDLPSLKARRRSRD